MADETRNVNQSFVKRVVAQLDATETVVYPGLNADKSGYNSWVEPRILGRFPRASRKTQRHEVWRFQVDCYANVDKALATVVEIDKHWQLADAVIAAFDQIDFAIQDWQTGGNPTLGFMRCSEVEVIEISSGDPNLLRTVCTFHGDFII